MFNEGISSCSCSDWDVLKSRMLMLVINLSALFCDFWSVCMLVFASVCIGTDILNWSN